jgi:uncharacterized protein YjbJ (UPF0337 family)
MNREVLENQWVQVREIIRDKFPNLTDEDIRQINGRYDQLVAKLQQKYGYSREEAEERIRTWNFDRFAAQREREPSMREDKYYREERARRKEDTWSPLTWLLALGIPLLLLGAYFFGTARNQETTPPTTIREQTFAETPADRAISNGLRNAMIMQLNMPNETQNVQITTRNGVVTLSGTVPNREIRDAIENTAENYTGVRQVINNLQVR